MRKEIEMNKISREDKLSNIKKETKKLSDIFLVCVRAYCQKVYSKTMMDTVVEVQNCSLDVMEKLKLIIDRTKDVEETLYPCLAKVSLRHEGEVYMEEWMEDTMLRYLVAKAIHPHIQKVQERYKGEQRNDLYEYRNITYLARNIVNMMEVLTHTGSVNRTCVMNKLLEIVDAILEKAADFWQKWSCEVEEVIHNLPMEEFLDNLHKEGYYNLDIAATRMMPEVVATYFLYYHPTDYLLYQLKLQANGEDIEPECSTVGYQEALIALDKGQLLEKNVPLKEQLQEILDNILLIGNEAQYEHLY